MEEDLLGSSATSSFHPEGINPKNRSQAPVPSESEHCRAVSLPHPQHAESRRFMRAWCSGQVFTRSEFYQDRPQISCRATSLPRMMVIGGCGKREKKRRKGNERGFTFVGTQERKVRWSETWKVPKYVDRRTAGELDHSVEGARQVYLIGQEARPETWQERTR